VRHPLVDREITIIGDAILVDPAFGTGAVKVTPAHDPNDYEVGKRHNLEFITIFDEHAAVNEQGGRFAGMDRFEARKAIKAAITELGLDRGAKAHTMSLGRSQRSGAVVEPMVSTQWFVAMKPLAAPALAAVEFGATRFVPAHWENTYFSWLRNIRDWCISRQLWWGHRIPAWYGPDGEVFVARDEDEAAGMALAHYGQAVALTRDEDVLDTWFSSALWPFSTLNWPERHADLAKWYPTSVLVTGYDIIFFWVARMMFSGLHNMGAVPFHDVYIHGLIRASSGEKMSKTKGNVVDPLEAIDKHGCDAFRYTMLQSATAEGRDFNWDESRVELNTRFVNKIWQAFRYAHMNLEGYDPAAEADASVYDRWILARAGQAATRIRAAIKAYRFNEAAMELHAFTWGELCDWYLELSKSAIYGGGAPRAAAQRTLAQVFSAVARLAHPMMPFLTEEIWQRLPADARGDNETVMLAPFPDEGDYPHDPAILAEVAVLQDAIVAVRRIKSEMNLSPGREVRLLVSGPAAEALSHHLPALGHLAKVSGLEAIEGEPTEQVATAVLGDSRLFVPLAGLVDLDAERERLDGELQKVAKDIAALEKKLGNTGFVAKAPADVVQKFREKLDAARQKSEALTAARAALS
jgi:valyl-tRNA synthetase